MSGINRSTAKRIADAMNRWTGRTTLEVITPEEVMQLVPVASSDTNNHAFYCYQWGDVTIVAHVRADGSVTVQHLCW